MSCTALYRVTRLVQRYTESPVLYSAVQPFGSVWGCADSRVLYSAVQPFGAVRTITALDRGGLSCHAVTAVTCCNGLDSGGQRQMVLLMGAGGRSAGFVSSGLLDEAHLGEKDFSLRVCEHAALQWWDFHTWTVVYPVLMTLPPTWVKQAQAANPGSPQSKFPPQPSECNDKTLSTRTLVCGKLRFVWSLGYWNYKKFETGGLDNWNVTHRKSGRPGTLE
ncbi:hypothetical protein EDD15DRAFT_2200008 [Pisolithus albus]|nr:hypothetical protein EDD15DRAFT_2200008 [Pisolithus albus]